MVARKKYLWRHPSGRIYVRLKGVLRRIKAAEGTKDFDREYWEILTGKPVEAKTSWNALIADYRASERWNRLKPRTRQDYEKILSYIKEKIGTRNVKDLARVDVIAAQKANLHRTRFANYIPQVMVVLCEHAIDIGWITQNPAKGVRAIQTPDERKKEHVPWTDEAVRKFREQASPLPRLIFEIGVGSVQRPADWVRFAWEDYDGDSLKIEQGKTGLKLTLPCTAHLKAALDEAKRSLPAIPHAKRRILTMPDGRSMPYREMARIMLDERRRLDVEQHDLHAMRYRGIMELAWQGCSDDEIGSYSGHRTTRMIRKYAGEARQVMQARKAREKRK